MKIQKPTEDTCWDGREHEWYGLHTRLKGVEVALTETYCNKCGRLAHGGFIGTNPTIYDHLTEEATDAE